MNPVIIGSNVYIQHVDRTMNVFKDNAGVYQSIGTGILLDNFCSATPAYANGFIYLRSKDNLYCIGN